MEEYFIYIDKLSISSQVNASIRNFLKIIYFYYVRLFVLEFSIS